MDSSFFPSHLIWKYTHLNRKFYNEFLSVKNTFSMRIFLKREKWQTKCYIRVKWTYLLIRFYFGESYFPIQLLFFTELKWFPRSAQQFISIESYINWKDQLCNPNISSLFKKIIIGIPNRWSRCLCLHTRIQCVQCSNIMFSFP